ncbi:MAG: ParA family protein, partial [Candidatus Eremiobacterota bacterium]
MSVPLVAFFNNKGGVGKTTLLYHVSCMLNDLGVDSVVMDLDPQANLSSCFLEDERLEELWDHGRTVFGCIRPVLRGIGDVADPHPVAVADHLTLVVGDLNLSQFEDKLSQHWPGCLDRKEDSFRVLSAFWRIAQRAAEAEEARLVLVDLGPNLGALNRAALVSCDSVVIPMGPDLFSLRALQNVGPTLREWRRDWADRVPRNPEPEQLALPTGQMRPVGYVLMQHSERLDRPVQAYQRWIGRIPEAYAREVLGEPSWAPSVREDPNCLALLKHYRSLVPMGQEARKPIFA